MAIRDSRKSRSRLLLFIASISLGIAAMVGIVSFRQNLLKEIDLQAKELVGADVRIRGNRDLPDSLLNQFKKMSVDYSRENFFSSMVLFPESGGTRLTQVRALQGAYPYYGSIETIPSEAGSTFLDGKYALVDEKLILQYDAQVGDSIKVGAVTFKILGTISKVPGRSDVSATIAPIVYIPHQFIEETGLIQKGSRISYFHYFQFGQAVDTVGWVKLSEITESKGYDVETIEEEKEETGEAFSNLSSFLELVAFAALLLGCLGVSSAIYVYARSKVQSVAVLRCLGMRSWDAVGIYLIQVVLFGLIGAGIGSALGMIIHYFLPTIAKDFLPVSLDPVPYWPALLMGLAIGMVVSLLFGLLSLVGLRNISPLSAIRFGASDINFRFDRLLIPIGGAILLFIFLAVFWQIESLIEAVNFSAILVGSILFLFALGKGFVWLARRLIPKKLPYVWRQGFSNLYRPNNQTVILITTLGLGTAFLATLYFMQDLLVERVSLSAAEDRPNTILFDIQSSQHLEVKSLTKEYGLSLMQDVPVVTMRLLEVNGYTKDEAFNDSTVSYPDWAYSREYRVTYRDSLIDSEELVEGNWEGKAHSTDSIFISVAEDFMDLKLGDELLFNVQGAILKTYVGSFREIDWRRVQTNFLILFPSGVLERAPQFHVLVTRIDSKETAANFQLEAVQKFPNLSIIDLDLILKTVEEVLAKIAFVIRFMAYFSIGTGIIVMISSIILSRYQRIKENALLRTLGASRRQLWVITVAEYLFLGAMSALSGLFLSGIFATLLGIYSFDFVFTPDLTQMAIVFLLVTALSVIIGLFNSRRVVSNSPMEVLRREA